jgi:hypothetical protein
MQASLFEHQPTLRDGLTNQPEIAGVDTVASELLSLGWLVRLHRAATTRVPLLLVSRTAFDPSPSTVHFLAHRHLGLETSPGNVVDVGAVTELHHRLQGIHHHHTPEDADLRMDVAP